MNSEELNAAVAYAEKAGGSGCIIRHGRMVMSWGDQKQKYDLYSTTKSIGVTALGLAIDDGKVKLSDRMVDHLPNGGIPPEENAATGWLDEITLFHLATHTAGFEKTRGWCALQFRPGTGWLYSDGGANWLADCLTKVYGMDLLTLMTERVFQPLGITVGHERSGSEDLWWGFNRLDRGPLLDGINRRPMGAGIFANVEAMARIGYLYLRSGNYAGRQIVSPDFVSLVGKPAAGISELPVRGDNSHRFEKASQHYGLLWWNNGDGAITDVPKDAYWSWGLKESLIVVVPSLDLVIARAGEKGWQSDDWGSIYEVLSPFLAPICRSCR